MVSGVTSSRGNPWAIYQFINRNFVIVGSFSNEFFQFGGASFFFSLESRIDLFQRISDQYGIVFTKINLIALIQSFQGIIVTDFLAKIPKKLFKYIRHPIPRRAYVKYKSVSFQLGALPPGVLFFSNIST